MEKSILQQKKTDKNISNFFLQLVPERISMAWCQTEFWAEVMKQG